MKNTTRIRTHFIYEVDNIPDHRSRRFGCCPCLMAVREFASFQQKSRVQAATRTRQAQNQLTLNKSILPFHHNMPAHAKQAGRAVLRNSHLIYKGELT